MRRLLEIILSIGFLFIFWWVYVIAYIGIKVNSPGPAFFKAKRVGKEGKIITVFKFRSMRLESGKVKLTTLSNDDRVFPFGKLIRKAKIDEFPQIFNILNGTMEIVGPRPEDVENADKYYLGKYKNILSVKPGLTSPASLYDYVVGEEYTDESLYEKEVLQKKLEMELYYIQHKSFIYDVSIVIRTFITIVGKVLGLGKRVIPQELKKI